MGLVETLLGLSARKKNTDYAKIRVTSNGAFYMKSEDIFDDKDKSLKLIGDLRESVKKYQVKKRVAVTPKTQATSKKNA